MLQFEKAARRRGYTRIAGVDEVGRGPLAGPVVAAACLLPVGLAIKGINDSKQLSPKKRDTLFEQLTATPEVVYAIGIVDAALIDQINIYQATIQAMLQAVARLKVVPDILLVDGMALPHPTIPSEKIIKGDTLSLSIAAASILAKVTRDRMMCEWHLKWPEYGFDQHKGYGTEKHCAALAAHGPCPLHRRSFAPVTRFPHGT